MESYSVKEDGVHKSRKKVLRNLGPLSRFDDGKPDYLERLRASFKAGMPMIKELEDLGGTGTDSKNVKITFDKTDDAAAFSDPKNIGYFLLDGLYDQLGIYDVLNLKKSRSKITYDLNGITRLLLFGRVLNPGSKCATWKSNGDYLFRIASSDKLIEVYRALSVLDEKSEAIQLRTNTRIKNSIGRDTDICFYDVTNYWFEIDDNDGDEFDKNGNIIREGLRKSGPSKAKNRKPIAQMGLFMDSDGIPISYRLFPGNHIDQTTLRPAMKKTIGRMDFGRVIIVADGGLNSGKNLAHIVKGGNGYIVSKSAKGSVKKVKQWILGPEGYVYNETGTFKSKSQVRERTVTDEDGNDVAVREKIISFWSKSQYDRALHENRKFIDYLNAVTEFPDKLKDKQGKLKKYLKVDEVNKETGEIVKTVSCLSLDMDKINTDLGLMGYHTLMTSEVDMPDRDVIDKYHGLSRIEDCFRTIKSDLSGRPVNVNTPEHVNAHFLICFLALMLIRIIQNKILKHLGKETRNVWDWELGLSADRIKEALNGFRADALPGGYYRLSKPTDDLALIMDAFGIDTELRIPTGQQLRQLKYSFDKAKLM
jgi:transposase